MSDGFVGSVRGSGVGAAGGGRGAAGRPDRLLESAREFEAFFVQMLLKQVRSSARLLSEGEKGGIDRQTYEGWQDEHLARSIAAGGGIGIAELLYREWQQQVAEKAGGEVTGS